MKKIKRPLIMSGILIGCISWITLATMIIKLLTHTNTLIAFGIYCVCCTGITIYEITHSVEEGS